MGGDDVVWFGMVYCVVFCCVKSVRTYNFRHFSFVIFLFPFRFFSLNVLGIISYQLNPVVLAQIVPVLLSVLESPDSDLVVVMTTVSSLGLILQVDGFLRSKILTTPDIVRTVSVLCLLTTTRLEEEDTKERVITVIRDLLGSLGMSFFNDMEVFSALTYHLTTLWGSSDPTSRLRLAIIEVKIVN